MRQLIDEDNGKWMDWLKWREELINILVWIQFVFQLACNIPNSTQIPFPERLIDGLNDMKNIAIIIRKRAKFRMKWSLK